MSITRPQQGDRASRARRPGDLTGMTHQKLLAEKAAKDAAKQIDVEQVRTMAFQEGHDSGWRDGWNSAIDAIQSLYEQDGLKAVQGLLNELTGDNDDDGQAA